MTCGSCVSVLVAYKIASGRIEETFPNPGAEPTQIKTKKLSAGALKCRRKFLRFFPGGFSDETYISWEREYKVEIHERWEQVLSRGEFSRLLRQREFAEVAARAVRVEQRSRHSMISSFEKMALRDAVKSEEGARAFAAVREADGSIKSRTPAGMPGWGPRPGAQAPGTEIRIQLSPRSGRQWIH